MPRLTGRTGKATRPTPAGFDRRLSPPMLFGSVLDPVNSSMIAVALVPIGAAFGAPPAGTARLVPAPYLATAVGQPVIGRLVDMYGLGTSAAYPAAVPPARGEAERTGRGSPAGVPAAPAVAHRTVAVVGPALGGLLTGLGGRRAVFTVDVPLSAVCLVPGTLRLPRSATRRRARRPARHGAVRAAAGRVDAVPAGAARRPLVPAGAVGPRRRRFSGARAAGAGPVHRPACPRRQRPAARRLSAPAARLHTSYAFMYGCTQWLERGRGLGASTAGLVLLPLSVTALIVFLVRTDSALWLLSAVGALLGGPQGLIGPATQHALYRQADPERIASAAGLPRTFMYLGALGASAATAAFHPHRADPAGLHGLALFMLAGSALLPATVLPDRSPGRLGTTTRTTGKA
ncbi:hypothetical protein FB563_8089 [Streptomyces puniciscabiei]|uniref:MFS transporter n=1 Tax=Streptomyces puniciscabiei TaxID=164348 RepID=A0A542SXP2_9ACTN|nr:hypothetical protein FB563_8089 [Streptomyces puniciscabiei]